MKSIFTPVKTAIAVLTLLVVSTGASAQSITINSASPVAGCEGGTVSVTFTTKNGGGTANKFFSVEEAANSGYPATSFTILLSGSGTYSRTFQVSGVDFPNPANGELTLTYAIPVPLNAPAGNYTLQLSSVNPTVAATSTSVDLDLSPNAMSAGLSPANISVCAGDAAPSLTFTGSGAVGGSYTFYYSINGAPASVTTANGVATANVSASTASAGVFTYELTGVSHNASACGIKSVSGTATVTVNALPSGSIQASNGLALNCNIPSTTLTAPAGSSYMWSTGAATASIEVTTAGTFTVVVSNDEGCSAEFSATTTLDNTLPTVGISQSAAELTCTVNSIVLTATGANSYSWSGGLGNTASITVSQAGTYTVTGTSTSNGCSSAISVTISENLQPASITVPASTQLNCNTPQVQYDITGATNVTVQVYSGPSPSISTSAVSFSAAGSYRIDAFNGNCLTSENVTITEAALPTATISAPAAVCSSNPAAVLSFGVTGSGIITVTYSDGVNNFTVAGPAGTLTANVSPAATTTFSIVSVVDEIGCVNTASSSATISVSSCGVTFHVDRVDPSCAGGTNGKIVITSISGDGAPFQISKDNGFSFEPVSNPALFEFRNLGAGVYNIILKNKDGELQPLSTTSLVDPRPITANLNTSGNISCGTPEVSLMISNIQGGNGAPYLFSLNGGAFSSNTNYTIGAGTHTISAQDRNGCSMEIGSVTLVAPAPVVLASPVVTNVSTNGGNNGAISLRTSGGSGSYMVTLVRPDGSNTVVNAGTATVSFTSLTAGSYEIMVTDNDGCGSVNRTVNISQPEQAPLPAADLVLGSEASANTFRNTGSSVTIVYNVVNVSASGAASGVKLRIVKPNRDYQITLPATSSYTNGAGELIAVDNGRWSITENNDMYVELSLNNDPNGDNSIPAAMFTAKKISVVVTRSLAGVAKGEFPVSAMIYASLPDANDLDNGSSHRFTAQ